MTKPETRLPTEKDIEDYELLKDILYSQKKEFQLLSAKKPDTQLNSMKMKMVNRALKPLKELFQYEESHKFLDAIDEEEMPTNSDIVLIISQYETAIDEFKARYYGEDKYKKSDYGSTIHRWMTKECPSDYYKNK